MNSTRQITAWFCFLILVCSASAVIAAAQSQEQVLTVTAEPNQGIRDISAKYLKNPDLWEDILHANGLKTADQVVPGMTLSIPVQAISQANSSLEAATKLIQQATENGAKRFAVAEIDRSVKIKDEAIEKRKAGLWAECAKLANTASDEAKKAYEISLKQQNVAVEAKVDYYQGDVHRRKTADSLWEAISKAAVLAEGETIRTLARSYADLLFSDNGRLKLGENSQAMIRKLRANILDDTEEATVSMSKGVLSALLSGGKKGNQFKLDIPGININNESKQFFVGVGEKGAGARIANYDEGKLEIEAKGGKVVLGKNQGSVVRENQKPSEPTDLLPSPRLIEPSDNAERFNTDIALTWERVPGAESFLLQFSDEETFSKLLWEETVPVAKADKKDAASDSVRAMFPSHLGTGTFYWRVSSVSADELPGPPSSPGYFRVMKDSEPPYLVILSPDQGASFTEPFAEISGSTEKDATLSIQDHAVKPDSGGEFRFRCDLSEGENRIVIKAADRAGNVNSLERIISRVTEEKSDLTFDSSLPRAGKNHFLVKNNSFSLTGKTWPRGLVSVRHSEKDSSESKEFSAAAVADDKGMFQINARLSGLKDEFIVTAISPAGETGTENITAEIDDEPPVIRLNEVISSPTAQKKLIIAGETEGAASLTLNGAEIPLTVSEAKSEIRNPKSLFNFPFELKAGKNLMRVEARDAVGNISIFEKEILSDSDAPVIAGYDLSQKKAKGGDELRVTVRVKDASGIKKIAPFEMKIGESDYAGQMLRSDSGGEYIGVFRVPGNISGTVKLKSITLSDYLGNTKKYDF